MEELDGTEDEDDDGYDLTDWDSRASQSGNYFRSYSQWYSCKYSRGHSSYRHYPPPQRSHVNPQPQEARRWWRQASHDIQAFNSIKDDCFEWICYMAHQVDLF